MEELRVFIASSNDEKVERIALRKFLLNMNEVTSKFGVTLIPEMWELKSANFQSGFEPKQIEYNQSLISSDIVLFIFGKRVGKNTRIEFEEACEQILNRKSLKVFVYFKDVEIKMSSLSDVNKTEGINDIAKLKHYISETLQQVYVEFESIEQLLGEFTKEVLLSVFQLVSKTYNFDRNIQKLIELYNDTNKPFQIDYRNNIIEEAINSLFFYLKYDHKTKLDETSFYEILHVVISNAREGASINALSLMLKCEWDDSQDEQNFWLDNQSAVKRRVNLERIFIVNRAEAHRLKKITQIVNHIALEEAHSNIHSYVVEKEKLQSYPKLLEQAGNGFILIDSQQDNIALLDEVPESGQRARPILNSEELNDLVSTFNSIKKLSVPLKEYLNSIKWSHCKKEMISIFLTTKCNLNCDYCFTNKNQGGHKGQTISFDFVKKGIDEYFNTEYMRHVRFFGAGEPTEEFGLLKEIHKYAKNQGGPSVTFEIQTNGAFSDNVAKWLRDNIDIIWISCDGTPDIQDKHRPFFGKDNRKTSAVIEKNIQILQEKNARAFVGIRATITSENIDRQEEMIDYFYTLGIRDIWVDPIFPSVGEKSLNEMNEKNDFDSMLFAKEFLSATKYAHDKGIFYGSILTCNFNDSVNKHCRACLPVPHLTTDGFVSACDMALFGKDENHMSELIYGKWDEDNNEIIIDPIKIAHIRNRTTENMKHCEMCASKEHCGGYCLGEVLNETGKLCGQKEGACAAIRYLDKCLDQDMRQYKYTHP